MISVAINSLNEGEKLERCLKSVYGWADEIIVVNMESTDSTEEVAKKYNAKIFTHPKVDYVEPVREFQNSIVKCDWVLILDPDEVVTDDLKNKLLEISRNNLADAVNIPRVFYIGKTKIKHTNFWPDRQIRFFKKGKLEFSKMIHSYPKVHGEVLDLPAKENLAIQHFSYSSWDEYWQRLQRYAQIEAQNLHDEGVKFSYLDCIKKPMYDFLRRYIRHLGILDGLTGLRLSLLQADYYLLVEYKLKQLSKK